MAENDLTTSPRSTTAPGGAASVSLVPKAEDEKILADLTKQCADKTAQYEDLKMVRANEEAAVAQAILILNSDAALESFGATAAETSGNTGFILLRYSTTVRRQVRHLLEIAKEKDESNAEQRRTWNSRSQAENVNFSANMDSWKSGKCAHGGR